MSLEKFVDVVAEATDRRRFLKKLGIATLTVTAGALATTRSASAAPICCNLCHPNGGTSCSGCACRWSWQCCHVVGGSGILYECGECFDTTGCSGCCTGSSCNHVKCSWYRSLNQFCL